MSDIQRFQYTEDFGLSMNRDGMWVRYSNLLWYKRHWVLWAIYGIVISLAFGFVCALLVYEKASHSPVVVPMGAAERVEMQREISALQKERAEIQKQRDDQLKLTANYKAQIKVLNAKADDHVVQLTALQARGQEIDRLAKDEAKLLSPNQGVVVAAERVLGVKHVKVVE